MQGFGVACLRVLLLTVLSKAYIHEEARLHPLYTDFDEDMPGTHEDLAEHILELRSYFREVDIDRDGHLSPAELHRAGVREEGLTEDDVDEVMQRLRGDRGGISWDEYVHTLDEETRAFEAHTAKVRAGHHGPRGGGGTATKGSPQAARRRDTHWHAEDGEDPWGDDEDGDAVDAWAHDFDPEDVESRLPYNQDAGITYGWHADEDDENVNPA